MKKQFLISAVAGFLVMASATSSAHAASDDAVTCRNASIPVALEEGQAASYNVAGELCATDDELRSGATVQLLIHGATYNHDYWDFGKINGVTYSYARAVAAQGFPTFAIDLPGSGDSSRPASSQMTAQAAAFVAHQAVQALRNGLINGVHFGKVIVVGHSLGSVVVWLEAVKYADVDGAIVTGAAHSITTRFLTANALYPAVKDPKFAKIGLDSGYLTTIPGTRITLFYSAPDFDPAVLAADEERKDVVPAAELGTGLPVVTSTDTLAIKVPVLTILGSNDFTTCGTNPQGGTFDCSSGAEVAKQEVPFYSAEARIHGCIVPDSGHDLSLAMNHRLQVEDSVAWSRAFVGGGPDDDQNRLPWNDGLPWNCGGISAESK